MKRFGMLSLVAVAMFGWVTSYGQDIEPEVPGDHFSLEGALELFKKSKSPEEFERLLNSPDSKVNNLDLNGDGYIDYVRVFDRQEGNVHVFILQAVVSASENQDIAVIELEKQANGKAVLQIVGDEDIYGVETIIEPTREVRTYAGTMSAPAVVNVWTWPVVQYVYGPRYTIWYSPWGWSYRPVWWSPWRPVVYVHYYHYWRPYRPYYSVCHTRRIVYAHHIYRPHRATSVIVHNRHHGQVSRYRATYADRSNGRDRYENDRRRSADRDRQEGRDDAASRGSRGADNTSSESNRTMVRDRSTEVRRSYTRPGENNTGRRTFDAGTSRRSAEGTLTPSPQRRAEAQRPQVQQRLSRESAPERNSSMLNRSSTRNRSFETPRRESNSQLSTPSPGRSRSSERIQSPERPRPEIQRSRTPDRPDVGQRPDRNREIKRGRD